MRSANIVKACCVAWLLLPGVCEAWIFRFWSPEELEPQASLICNGTVLSIEETGIKTHFPYPDTSPPAYLENVMRARIEVRHVFKGQVPAVIEFTYRVRAYEHESTDQVEFSGGPMHVALEKGQRYRFFLKPGGLPDQYVGVLNSDTNDIFDVETLWPNEPDDSPYLHKEDAIMIAREYARSKKIELKADWSTARVDGPIGDEKNGATWRVVFSNPQVKSHGFLAIVVRGDRTVDPARTRLKND